MKKLLVAALAVGAFVWWERRRARPTTTSAGADGLFPAGVPLSEELDRALNATWLDPYEGP